MHATDPERALVPIFVEDERSSCTRQIGTPIFVDFQSMPFLFTAAHVIDEAKKGRLMAPTPYGILDIDGYLAYVDLLPEMFRQEDEIDIAYWLSERICFSFFPPFSWE